jgi:hypothetical protein
MTSEINSQEEIKTDKTTLAIKIIIMSDLVYTKDRTRERDHKSKEKKTIVECVQSCGAIHRIINVKH